MNTLLKAQPDRVSDKSAPANAARYRLETRLWGLLWCGIAGQILCKASSVKWLRAQRGIDLIVRWWRLFRLTGDVAGFDLGELAGEQA